MSYAILQRIALGVGAGLLAGAAGTAAMTVSSTLEARLRKRESSSTPSNAAGKVLGVVWGSSLVMLPTLGVAPPPWQQPPAELGIDALHHVVYAGATSAAWRAIVS
jgi:hypothetical protein